jgi:hypothetical protein
MQEFLHFHAPQVADEIKATYVGVMGTKLRTLFKAYHTELSKMELVVATKHHVVALEVRYVTLRYVTVPVPNTTSSVIEPQHPL